MSEIEISYTSLGFVDIRKYVYDSLVNYVPLIEKIGTDNVFIREQESIAKKSRPFVSISDIGGCTNDIGIRSHTYQIDVWAESVQSMDEIKYIIIDLLNRRNLKGIKSRLDKEHGSRLNKETGLSRAILDFDFVFKDMKY